MYYKQIPIYPIFYLLKGDYRVTGVLRMYVALGEGLLALVGSGLGCSGLCSLLNQHRTQYSPY